MQCESRCRAGEGNLMVEATAGLGGGSPAQTTDGNCYLLNVDSSSCSATNISRFGLNFLGRFFGFCLDVGEELNSFVDYLASFCLI